MRFDDKEGIIEVARKLLAKYFPEKAWLATKVTISEAFLRLKDRFFKVDRKKANSKKAQDSNDRFSQYYNIILYLVPGNLLKRRTCVNFANCLGGCLFWSGHGGNFSIARARVIKTLGLFFFPAEFRERIASDADATAKKCKELGKTLVLRLNGTSDLHPRVFGLAKRDDIIRNEYTKCLAYFLQSMTSGIHTTYSHWGNVKESETVLDLGGCVTLVVPESWSGDPKDLPEWTWKWPKSSADEHDLRFLDEPGHIKILKEKKGGFSQSHRRTELTKLAAA